jgi:hypothetical protein
VLPPQKVAIKSANESASVEAHTLQGEAAEQK